MQFKIKFNCLETPLNIYKNLKKNAIKDKDDKNIKNAAKK